jgi:sulfur carrier protein ThiS
MKIKVKLYTILKKYGAGKIGEDGTMVVAKDLTISGLLSKLSIPEKTGKVFLVNDFPKDDRYELHEGDEVKILSFIGGG